MWMKNRSKYEVMAAILSSLDKEESRTKIMYKSMLSNEQCKTYIESLIEKELIQEIGKNNKALYKITQKGIRFLSCYNKIKELLPICNEGDE